MQQTLLSLVALLIATLLSFNQLRAGLQSQKQTVRAEMEMMALGVAMQTMEVIRARAFDAETAGDSNLILDPTELSSTPFTTGNHCQVFGGSDTCNDVDDFHEMKTATVSHPLPKGEDFDFAVDVRVQYVDGNLEPTGGTRTFRKEVTIFVQDVPDSGDARLPDPIEYSEVLSYP